MKVYKGHQNTTLITEMRGSSSHSKHFTLEKEPWKGWQVGPQGLHYGCGKVEKFLPRQEIKSSHQAHIQSLQHAHHGCAMRSCQRRIGEAGETVCYNLSWKHQSTYMPCRETKSDKQLHIFSITTTVTSTIIINEKLTSTNTKHMGKLKWVYGYLTDTAYCTCV
jgi:hypothetical protein